MVTPCTNLRHILTPIDVHNDAKITLDVMLTFVNRRQKKSIDVNLCQLTLEVPGTIEYCKILNLKIFSYFVLIMFQNF